MKTVWVVMKSEYWEPQEWVDKIFDSEEKALDYLKDFEVTLYDSKTNKPYAFKEVKRMANGYSNSWGYTIEEVEVH